MAQSGLPALDVIPNDPSFHAASLPPEYEYYVYISHSDDDQELFRHLQEQLEQKGYKIFVHEPGQSKFCDEMDKCYKILTIITNSYMSEKWQELETANYITKSTEGSNRIMIPILHNIEPHVVPSYVKEVNYLQTSDKYFWKKLTKALNEEVSLTATIPIVDIANGLAWAYYYGYLSLVLPSLKQRMEDSKYAKEGKEIFTKLIILLPESGFCAKDVKEVDTNFTSAGFLKFEITRSAIHKRDFGNAVLKMMDPTTGKERYVVMEYATPIWTMYEMEMGRIAGLGPNDKRREMKQFQEQLDVILKHNNCEACYDKYILLPYNDRDPDKQNNPHALSQLVSSCIAADLQK